MGGRFETAVEVYKLYLRAILLHWRRCMLLYSFQTKTPFSFTQIYGAVEPEINIAGGIAKLSGRTRTGWWVQ